MDTLYRIHTEASNPTHETVIHAAISPYFEAYNVLYGQGSWRGTRERSATIEVYGTQSDGPAVEAVARAIMTGNNQEAVLVSTISAAAQLTFRSETVWPASIISQDSLTLSAAS